MSDTDYLYAQKKGPASQLTYRLLLNILIFCHKMRNSVSKYRTGRKTGFTQV